MALLTTVTSVNPAAWILRRRTEAPIADEPMPASQAKTIERTAWPGRGSGGGAGSDEGGRGDGLLALHLLHRADGLVEGDVVREPLHPEQEGGDDERHGAESATAKVTPTKLPRAVTAYTAKIEPGAAGR